MAKEIFIVRHGETEFNRQHIVQGSGVDSSLNETGINQAAAFHDAYKNIGFELVFTSALKRTVETAQNFLDMQIPHIADADINEISWGIYEGKSVIDGMKEAYKSLMTNWASENYDERIEEGESAAEMATRLQRFLNRLKARSEEKILVVMHGRTIRCLMCLIDGKPIKHMDDYSHHNTGVYKVRQIQDKLEIYELNSIDHLKVLKDK